MNERPAYWGVGFGLGLALAGGFVVADAYAGLLRPGWWALYPALVLSGMGTVVTLAGLGKGLSWALVEWDEMQARRNPPALAPETAPEPDDEGPDYAAEAEYKAKLDAVMTFFHAGERAGGFSAGLLSPGVVGSDTWDALTDFYVSEVGRRVLRVVAGNVGTVWNHGHTLDSTIRGLRAGLIPLPPGPVPVVSAYVPPAAQRNAPRKSATKPKPAVVDIPPSREVVAE